MKRSLMRSIISIPAWSINLKRKKSMKKVQLHTNHGIITVVLDDINAPKSVENFMAYALNGFYDGTIFHRVIKGFMIQGGGFDTDMKQKSTNPPIANEANNGLKNVKYSISMARTNAPHSATSQFFINSVDNSFLDFKSESPAGWGYAVFGNVIEGQEIVDAIGKVKTGRKGFHDDVPVENVILEKVVELTE